MTDKPSGGTELTVRGVVMRFGGITALAGVDLEVGAGELVGLIGPNGSGKTTLMNCISGVYKVTEGDILVGGHHMTSLKPQRRAQAGIARTFQNLKLFTELTVWENVAIGHNAGPREGRRPTAELLEQFGLADVANQVCKYLPYGYQRRVELARATAAHPRVLLLDEPAAGLNDDETRELKAQIVELRKDLRCSVLLIDHDMDLVVGLSDRIHVLDEGRTIFEGDPQQAMKSPLVVNAYLGES